MDSRELRERGLGRYENQIQTSSSNSRPERSRSRAQADQPRGNRSQIGRRQGRESLPDPPRFGRTSRNACRGILEKSDQLEAIEGALEIEKAELIAILPVGASVKTKLGRGG